MQEGDLIEWNESICLNIEEIDKQHKVLVDIINELARAVREDRVESSINEILQELIRYTNTHFNFEEIFFEDSDYSHRRSHLAEHKQFINRISIYNTMKKNNNANVSEDLLTFLKNWLVNHILITDQKYVPYFKQPPKEN